MAKTQNQKQKTQVGADTEFQKLADGVRAAHKAEPYQIETISGHEGESMTAIVAGGKKDTDPMFYVTVDIRNFKPSISLGKIGMDEYLTGSKVDALYKEIMAEEKTSLILPPRPKKRGS
jgi:hypothetical protein